MNIVRIGDMVKNDGYKICDFNASVCERYNFSERNPRHDDEECEEPSCRTRMERTICICLIRNNEQVKFSEEYDTDQKFGKDAAELSKLIAEVGTARNTSNKRRRR